MSVELNISEELEKGVNCIMKTRIVLSDDYKSIEAFAIIFLFKRNNHYDEIIKFDGNKKEALNAHSNLYSIPSKKYVNKNISWETVDEFQENIRQQWRWYLAQYKENHYI